MAVAAAARLWIERDDPVDLLQRQELTHALLVPWLRAGPRGRHARADLHGDGVCLRPWFGSLHRLMPLIRIDRDLLESVLPADPLETSRVGAA
jgi:hypothetical protein